MTALAELLRRVEAATGPDRTIDVALAELLYKVPKGGFFRDGLYYAGGAPSGCYTIPALTASADAALALIEDVTKSAHVASGIFGLAADDIRARGLSLSELPRRIIAALLKALIAQRGEG